MKQASDARQLISDISWCVVKLYRWGFEEWPFIKLGSCWGWWCGVCLCAMVSCCEILCEGCWWGHCSRCMMNKGWGSLWSQGETNQYFKTLIKTAKNPPFHLSILIAVYFKQLFNLSLYHISKGRNLQFNDEGVDCVHFVQCYTCFFIHYFRVEQFTYCTCLYSKLEHKTL